MKWSSFRVREYAIHCNVDGFHCTNYRRKILHNVMVGFKKMLFLNLSSTKIGSNSEGEKFRTTVSLLKKKLQ